MVFNSKIIEMKLMFGICSMVLPEAKTKKNGQGWMHQVCESEWITGSPNLLVNHSSPPVWTLLVEGARPDFQRRFPALSVGKQRWLKTSTDDRFFDVFRWWQFNDDQIMIVFLHLISLEYHQLLNASQQHLTLNTNSHQGILWWIFFVDG